jgi:uncharacterized DUF497 family protein
MHRCASTAIVGYEWDPKKAAGNLRRHGIDFADAATVLEDESALTVDDDDPEEKRFLHYRYGRIGARPGGCLYVARG